MSAPCASADAIGLASPRRSARGLTVLLAGVVLTACSGASTPAAAPRTPPDIAGFLRLPVATPAACAPSVDGTTSGRRSPWVGHVDISVFIDSHAPRSVITGLLATLKRQAEVRTVYVESQAETYAEFQRLYTCSAGVKASSLHASYRLVLHAVTQPQRDALVRRIHALPGVATVSCDPSNPCVDLGAGAG